ncbi:MAG: alpha/beta hydrolase [Spirochaetes bacterium]|nr:alpha/beta hydrolase [Spirochaetota bacterium]
MALTSFLKKSYIIALLILFAVIVLCAIVYVAADRETLTLDERSRADLGGTYIPLADGTTHYRIEGRAGGRPVVLVHGATIPSFCWDILAPDLARSGMYVLRYDMFGRGFSDRPRVTYDRDLYVRQLKDLLDGLKWNGPVDIVGYSMGAPITVTFAARYPERVRRVVLISPVIKDFKKPAIFAIPVFGEFIARIIGNRTVEKRAMTMLNTGTFAGKTELLRKQFRYRGFQQSILSMLRNDALGDYTKEYARLGSLGTPVMILWGTEDREITPSMVNTARRLLPKSEYHAVYGVGHGIVYQRPEDVFTFIHDFLKR